MKERTIIVTAEVTKVIKNEPSCFELDKVKLEELIIGNIKEIMGDLDDLHIRIQDFQNDQATTPLHLLEDVPEVQNNNAWRRIYDKVVELEYGYAESGDIMNVNECIQLENLLNFFKDDLWEVE